MAQKVLREEGPRGLYRGLAANLIGVTPEKAIKLAVNDAARAHFAARCQVPIDRLPVQYGMLSGALAGFCQVIATNPMEIVKIQMQLASTLPHPTSRPSLVSTVRSLGLGGLYRGAVSTLCRDVPFSIIFFQSFASCKALLAAPSQGGLAKTKPPTLSLGNTLLAGIMAGALAAYAATPMDGRQPPDQLIAIRVSPSFSANSCKDTAAVASSGKETHVADLSVQSPSERQPPSTPCSSWW